MNKATKVLIASHRNAARAYKTLHNLKLRSTMSSCHEPIDTCGCDTATNYRMCLKLIELEKAVQS